METQLDRIEKTLLSVEEKIEKGAIHSKNILILSLSVAAVGIAGTLVSDAVIAASLLYLTGIVGVFYSVINLRY